MISRRLSVLSSLSVLGMLLCSAASATAASVTLAWNPSPSPTVAGYRLYQGPASQTYTNTTEVGTGTSVTVSNLAPGVTYFFAVTAYDLIGLESAFSDEVSYTPSGTITSGAALLRISLSSGKGVLLTGSAPTGYQYDVLRTGDLHTWVRLGTVTADTTGSFQFADSLTSTQTPQYYRLHQISP